MSERFWASGHWQVKEGKTEEFIQQWKEWLSQSSENVPGFHQARLLVTSAGVVFDPVSA
jgi:heme-degrading monooxygenase HmoA